MTLRAGTARADITPADLTGLNPFGDDFQRVHDPIQLRALVLTDGSSTVAVVALDLVEVGDTTAIRDRIEAEVGIPSGAVMLAPSHAHNAPRIGLVPPGGKARIPTRESLAYTRIVYDAIVEALARAVAALEPAKVGRARGTADVNVSREAYADGRWGIGYNADGPSDKTLEIVSIVSTSGQPLAILMNYAVHSTVALGVPALSADLAGAASRYVEQHLGGGVTALWLSGALGDQAPRVSLENAAMPGDDPSAFAFAAVEAQGLILGAEALRVVRGIDHHAADADVAGASRVVPLPARRLPVPPGMEQADVDRVDLTLTAVRIGDVALAGVSGEPTVPVFRAVQAATPLARTLLVSNVNARIGYLPTDESYDRHTQAADGCPIVQGHAARTIVSGLAALITETMRT